MPDKGGDVRDFARLAPRILAILLRKRLIRPRMARARVDVFLTENRILRKLKKEFLRRDARVVDVLSFPEDSRFPDPERKGLRLGEIHLNRVIARRYPDRAKRLFIHGILHLLGYSHDGKRDTIEMENLEEDVLLELQRRER